MRRTGKQPSVPHLFPVKEALRCPVELQKWVPTNFPPTTL